MESPNFFCLPFKGYICYCKSLEITRRSVEAMKKENFCPLKKKCHRHKGSCHQNINPIKFQTIFNFVRYIFRPFISMQRLNSYFLEYFCESYSCKASHSNISFKTFYGFYFNDVKTSRC